MQAADRMGKNRKGNQFFFRRTEFGAQNDGGLLQE